MDGIYELKRLVQQFEDNIKEYKNKNYNEHSCRDEFINPFLEILGWDVTNSKGLAPQYREVIAEYHASSSDRPDYSLTLRGVSKFFVEAKKPHVDISKEPSPDIGVFRIPQENLDIALAQLDRETLERVQALKMREIEPERCEHCDYCRSTKIITKPVNYTLIGEE